ncbi:hypothetical protein ABZP36_013917 [Zizania latifolia]
MVKTRAAAMPRPAAAAGGGADATRAKISFRSRKIVKGTTSKAKPPTTITVPSPLPPVLLALSSSGELAAALRHLHSADPLLSEVIASSYAPTFISSPFLPAFHSLAHSILHQQFAPSATAAIYSRFLALLPSATDSDAVVNPTTVLALSKADLRAIGVSARKAAYLHDLAGRFAAKEFSDSVVAAMDEAALLAELTKVKGVGEWTVHMFMIFSLHRPDVLRPTTTVDAYLCAVPKNIPTYCCNGGGRRKRLADGPRPRRAFQAGHLRLVAVGLLQPTTAAGAPTLWI